MKGLRDLTQAQKRTADENGINRKALSNRLRYGWNVEEAITTPLKSQSGITQFYGIKFSDEQMEIARKNGISKMTLKSRCRKGWDLERAITQPVRGNGKTTYKVHDPNIEGEELMRVIGRIKCLRMQEKDFPMPIPKPLLNKLKQTGRTLDDVRAVKC